MKIVKFVQNNCPPCKMLGDTLDAMGLSVDEEILLTDENREAMAQKYDIMATPTLIAFEGDKEVARLVRTVGYGKVKEFFETNQ